MNSRETLARALVNGLEVIVSAKGRDGATTLTRGKVVSVTGTHTIIRWGAGERSESCLAIANIVDVKNAA